MAGPGGKDPFAALGLPPSFALASEVLDGRPDQRIFGVIDIAVRRNGYGRQVDSFETDIVVEGLHRPFHAVFIRAPKVESAGSSVEVLATHDGVPVLARQGHVMVASFHPEITADARLHDLFLQHHGITTEKKERG